jgi:hypothetical protein
VVSISACHTEDPGSIPGRGGYSNYSTLRIMNELMASHPARCKMMTRKICVGSGISKRTPERLTWYSGEAVMPVTGSRAQKPGDRAQMICRDPGSNRGPSDLQSDALPTELSRHVCMENFNDLLKARPHGLGGKCQAKITKRQAAKKGFTRTT